MADAKAGAFFSTTKKGEIAELREELNSPEKSKVKDAVKKVILAMTVGKDVSSLLADVVKNGQTSNLELKKLVYLYLINYAKSQPDLAILAVNTFVKDSQDPNPLIRALAVRTMGCIRVDKITEYLCDPLLKALRDEDPYVRKTAAICVAKLYDINHELVDERGFLDLLRELLGDSNPMVVANAVAALSEIADASGDRSVFPLTSAVLFKLLAALNECTEWGQVSILDALAHYTAASGDEAESLVDRVTPRLQHANCAVVLSAVKVVLKQLPLLAGRTELLAGLRRKLAPPLVTLLSSEPEVQYVVLRNINLIIQRYPSLLGHEVKVFFCKYNDPLYVKMEKLEILVRLASERTIEALLLEWREYAQEVDVDFVRKAVRAIGRAAISLESAAERCVQVLLELVQTKVSYVVQEAVVVLRDILRRYPGRYEGVISTLCECLDTLDEPEAKAALVWIVGEYAERIDNAEELLTLFADGFEDEVSTVQLALLTGCVKLFLKKPEPGPQALITRLLSKATAETDDPDLRDRAYLYWRLLSSDPEAARDVVLAEKPVIADDAATVEPALLDELLGQLATLASVYHKPAESFVSRVRRATVGTGLGEGDEGEEGGGVLGQAPLELMNTGHAPAPAPAAGPDLLGDLMSLSSPAPAQAPVAAPPPAAAAVDLLGSLSLLDGPPAAAPQAPHGAASELPVVVDASAGGGLEIRAAMVRGPAGPALALSFANAGFPGALDGFLLKLNTNALGLAPVEPLATPVLAPGHPAARVLLSLAPTTAPAPFPAAHVLQVAIKSPRHPAPGVFYFTLPLLGETCLTPMAPPPEAAPLAAAWKSLPEGSSRVSATAVVRDAADATARLRSQHVYVAHVRPLADGTVVLYAGCTLLQAPCVAEITARLGAPGARVTVKSAQPAAAALAAEAIERSLH